MSRATKANVLCVDDEPQVLEGLALHLGRRYTMHRATSGAEGLEVLARVPDMAVVISDMRMPGMDGAAFLSRVRRQAPQATRLLLTGHAEIRAAISAVNDGQIFRFLTKPCPPTALRVAVAAAVEQHRLVTAERVLLEQTLTGAIRTLTEVLSLAAPAAFGRASRIKRWVGLLAQELELAEPWKVEVAAMLSQLAYVALPPRTAEKLYAGEPLDEHEQEAVKKLPALTERLLGHIPRMEDVREILRLASRASRRRGHRASQGPPAALVQAASVLRVAVDFDELESALGDKRLAISTMRSRDGAYDREVLEALADAADAEQAPTVLEVRPEDLRVGMVLAEDVKLPNGALFVARGQEITERFIQRLHAFGEVGLADREWRVLAPAEAEAA